MVDRAPTVASVLPTPSGARHEELLSKGWWTAPDFSTVPSRWLLTGENRLDGGFYTQEVTAARTAVENCGCEVKPLADLVGEIYILGRFRRVYASERDAGWPYLGAGDALEFRPTSTQWLARKRSPKDASAHFAQRGWLLISASGSVGRMIVTTARLEPYFLTHDLLRVVPADEPPAGYLYAYLSSWLGQALLVKDQYGSAIKHLEPHHLAGVPVPLLSKTARDDVAKRVMRAFEMREQANQLLDDADALLHKELGLDKLDEQAISYLPKPPDMHARVPDAYRAPLRAFVLRSNDLGERLDASYHVPIARLVTDRLKSGKYPAQPLGTIVESIHLPGRFKRIYVDRQHGIPFLRPSHLPQIRPFDLGYISRRTPTLQSLLLHAGEVLVSTDGTVGRVGLVSSRRAGWAGSNNLARITYDTAHRRNGYLAAFLSTPYGYHQLTREIYGGVVDHLDASHVGAVVVPVAPAEVQSAIGELVVKAFELKDEAVAVEDAAIAIVEATLTAPKA